jgi:hypothetical protein
MVYLDGVAVDLTDVEHAYFAPFANLSVNLARTPVDSNGLPLLETTVMEIASVRIYNRKLTTEEVENNAQIDKERGFFAPLTGSGRAACETTPLTVPGTDYVIASCNVGASVAGT